MRYLLDAGIAQDADLRRMRRPMQIDIMVAAIAFALSDCKVVSNDTDLAAVPGLKLENWAQD
jgi:predicted nucleic acid-binding protein